MSLPPGSAAPDPARRARPVRALLIALGTLVPGFGALGLVVPVLPTTPFVLLAAARRPSWAPPPEAPVARRIAG